MTTKYIGPPYNGYTLCKQADEGVWTAVRVSPSTGQMVLQSGVQGPEGQPEGAWSGAWLRGSIQVATDGIYSLSALVNVGPVSMLLRGAYNMNTSIFLVLDDVEDFHTFYASGNTVGVNYGRVNLIATKSLTKGAHKVEFGIGTYMDYSGVPNPAPYAEIIATFSSLVVALPAGAAVAATSASKAPAKGGFQRPAGDRNLIRHEMSDIEAVSAGFLELK